MNTYLVVIITALVITQIIRVIQNATQLYRQKVLFETQLKELAQMNLTERDFEIQRKAYKLAVEFFERKAEERTNIQDREEINFDYEAEAE